MSEILSLRDIKRQCKRESGRTTIIQNIVVDFLRNKEALPDIKLYSMTILGVIVNKHSSIRSFSNELYDRLIPSMDVRFQGDNVIENNTLGRKVIIGSVDSCLYYWKGLRFYDIYFDVPEQDVFKDSVFELMTRLYD